MDLGKSKMKRKEPDWTPEQVIKVRQIYRKGGTVEDVIEMLGTKLEYNAVRQRAVKLGIRFLAVKRNHNGDSRSVIYDG
jgi:hypothetical protein